MKECNTCHLSLPFLDFHKMKASKDRHSNKCKICAKKYSDANKSRISENGKKWREENKEKHALRCKQWKLDNAETHKQQKKESRQRNSSTANANNQRKIASQKERTPSWLTTKDLLIIKEFYKMVKEKTKATGVKYHVDHIIPLQGTNVSGLHCPSNLQVLTATENCMKSNKFAVLGG